MGLEGWLTVMGEFLTYIGEWLDNHVGDFLQSMDPSVLAVSVVVLIAYIWFCWYIQVNKPKNEKIKKKYYKGCRPRVYKQSGRHYTKKKQKNGGASKHGHSNSTSFRLVHCGEISQWPPELLCQHCQQVQAKRGCRYKSCRVCCQGISSSICQVHGTGERVAQELVSSACREKHIHLDVSYTNLKNCPLQLGFVGSQLTSLNLSNNRLNSLPPELGLLRGLQELFLQYNCLEQLPDCIGNFDYLQELDCKNNHLRRLPSTIGNLRKLLVLNLTNNYITELPVNIGQLLLLEELCVHSNRLQAIPDSLCNLINLRDLYVGENHHLKQLPCNFGNLIRLSELDISSCALDTLPESLCNCTSLTKVWLSHNKLKYLPSQLGRLHQLKELHVCNNQLQYFPASISYLQLYTFRATNNPLLNEGEHKKCNSLSVSPCESVPPLQELTGRTLINHDLVSKFPPTLIPRQLKAKLQKYRRCSSCGGPFIDYFKSELCFATVFVFHRLPLYQQICSPHANERCSAVEIKQTHN